MLLVIDKQEKCEGCPMVDGNDECILQDEDANFAADTWEKMHEGCPLANLPERMDALKVAATIKGCDHPAIYAQGWNACIDAIMRR